MDFKQYQVLANRTMNYDLCDKDILLMGALGCCDESGEVAGIIKKHIFHGHTLDQADLKLELGDVLWYVNVLCTLCGWSIEDVADANIAKLQKRYPEKFSSEASINRLE